MFDEIGLHQNCLTIIPNLSYTGRRAKKKVELAPAQAETTKINPIHQTGFSPPKPQDNPHKGTSLKLPDLRNLHLEVEKRKNLVLAENTEAEEASFLVDTSIKLHSAEIKKWMEVFAEQKKALLQMNEYILLHERNFETIGNQILFHLDNEVQKDHLQQIKTDLGTYLREKMGLDTLSLEGKIVENEFKKVVFTATDRYKYLQEKYPILEDLKRRFGLENQY